MVGGWGGVFVRRSNVCDLRDEKERANAHMMVGKTLPTNETLNGKKNKRMKKKKIQQKKRVDESLFLQLKYERWRIGTWTIQEKWIESFGIFGSHNYLLRCERSRAAWKTNESASTTKEAQCIQSHV